MNDDFKPILGCDLRMKDIDDIKDVKKGNITYYYVKLKNNGGRCKECGEYGHKVKEYFTKTIPHSKNVIIKYKARRFICKCGKTFYEEDPFKSKDYKLSDNAIEYILAEIKRYNHNFSEIAQSLNISVTKIIEVFDSYVQIERKKLREVISIDEFYFSKYSKSKFAFMILGLNGEVLDVLDSRKKNALLDYFKYIPQEERKRVKYVTMDMNSVYKSVIYRRFKGTTICIDSFHVVQLLNTYLDTIRKRVMKNYDSNKGSDEYYLLKHKNYLLFKDLNDIKTERIDNRHYNILMSESELLDELLKIDDTLTRAYYLKEDYLSFNNLFGLKTRAELESIFDNYINDCLLSSIEQFIEFANTLSRWKEEILNSFIPYNGQRLSNGKIENKNKYVKKIKDIANGYANFKRFRNRIMYSENLYEKPLDEKSNKRIKRYMPKRGSYKKVKS
ncbi:MAG: ISL3 family transposase [Firmicutes bacterium]|nr:ISL3 family transposase [Candidatus Colivicinus equi]